MNYLTILPCFKTTAPRAPTFTRTRMVRMKRRSWQLVVSIGMWGFPGPPRQPLRDHRQGPQGAQIPDLEGRSKIKMEKCDPYLAGLDMVYGSQLMVQWIIKLLLWIHLKIMKINKCFNIYISKWFICSFPKYIMKHLWMISGIMDDDGIIPATIPSLQYWSTLVESIDVEIYMLYNIYLL